MECVLKKGRITWLTCNASLFQHHEEQCYVQQAATAANVSMLQEGLMFCALEKLMNALLFSSIRLLFQQLSLVYVLCLIILLIFYLFESHNEKKERWKGERDPSLAGSLPRYLEHTVLGRGNTKN